MEAPHFGNSSLLRQSRFGAISHYSRNVISDKIHPMRGKPTSRRKRVIAVLALNVFSGQRKLSGMIDFFNERLTTEAQKWDIDLLSVYERLTETAIRRYAQEGVDGFLVLCHPPVETIRNLADTRLPCIVETSAETPFESNANLVRIFCDTQEIARAAAQHFASRQIFKSFGYVNTKEEESWSKDRGRYFAEKLAERGHRTSVCNLRSANLVSWLKKLPKPTAVCAANDATARLVAKACERAKLSIPDDVALLGFDDDPVFCLGPGPRLSSVAQDFAQCGHLAAETLDRMMRGEKDLPETISYGTRGVVIRESTMRGSPHVGIVQKALSFIDENGCGNIGADDVAKHLGVSRRLIDLRFGEVLGHSIHEILRERKLEEVKRLLRTSDDSITDITAACGFTNKTHLKNLFRRCTGLSMRDYRKSV